MLFDLAIVGNGAASAIVATLVHQQNSNLRIAVLGSEVETLWQGIAYGQCAAWHLLNVRANRLSIFTQEPGHYAAFAAAQWGYQATDFTTRHHFGAYLKACVTEWVNPSNLHYFPEQISHITTAPGGYALRGRTETYLSKQVVIATGNEVSPRFGSLPNLYSVWGQAGFHTQLPEAVLRAENICIIGTGLSMVDMVESLIAHGYQGSITAYGAKGLLPMTHLAPEAHGDVSIGLDDLPSLADLLHFFNAIRKTGDVADLISAADSLRASTQKRFATFSPEEKRQLKQHLLPYWNILRHRMPPSSSAFVQDLLAKGQLRIVRTAIQGIEAHEEQLHLVSKQGQKFQHPVVIDASNLSPKTLDALQFESSLSETIATNLAVKRGVTLATGLFAIGGPLVPYLFESTAIPELRSQAWEIAQIAIRNFEQPL